MATILEKTHVFPSTDSSDSLPDFSLPLTFCDTLWFKFPPVERLFFYSLPLPKPTFLISTLPKLTLSLSHPPPLPPSAGNLTWPPDSPIPIVLYVPGDAVSFTIVESDAAADFDHLSGDHVREAASFHPFVPKLNVTETGTSAIALQITLFPSRGFCIGVTRHHAVLDGKSTTMFCRSKKPVLPPELTPFYDHDPNLFQFSSVSELPLDSVRRTFELTKADIAKLRQKALSTWPGSSPTKPHLTSFVLTFSHALLCTLKALEVDEETKSRNMIFIGLSADLRSRLTPPVPENYFGNCVGTLLNLDDARELLKEEDAFAAAALRTGELAKKGGRVIGVAGSPRFGVYGVDFGWGKPRKVEKVSVDRTGAISMASLGMEVEALRL
ncbi:hypothetical protein TIFTF001_049623, partial [Ficus carica]